MISAINNQRGAIGTNIVIGVIVLIGASVFWQYSDNQKQEQLDSITERVYTSPGGEFELTIPADWEIGQESYEEDGIVSLELYGPRNNVVNTAFAQREGVESGTIEEALSANRISELVDSPVGREYAIIQLNVTAATFFDLSPDKEVFKEALLETNDTASGVSYSEFIDFDIGTADGWKFDSTLVQLDDKITATNYYLIGDFAEVDALLYPANSNYAQAAEEIIKTLVIDEAVL